jgi:hypothetical protein
VVEFEATSLGVYTIANAVRIQRRGLDVHLTPGRYRVAATWGAASMYYAANAPFKIFDGSTEVGGEAMNQTEMPDDYFVAADALPPRPGRQRDEHVRDSPPVADQTTWL